MSPQLSYYYRHKERINKKRREKYREAQAKMAQAKAAAQRPYGTE